MTVEDIQADSPSAPKQGQDETYTAAPSTAEDETLGSSPENTADAAGESLLDVITKAVEDEKDISSESDVGNDDQQDQAKPTTEESGEPEPDKATDAEQSETTAEDDGQDVEPGQRIPYERFKKVIDQRDDWKGKVEAVEQEREQYRSGHEQFEAITGYMQQNNLQTQDVVDALQIAAAFNSDPARAAEMLAPKMKMLQQFTGEILPDELQQQVDMGEISEAAAREHVRLRHENARLQTTQLRRDQEQQQQVQAQQVENAGLQMAQAADAEQTKIAAMDPDYEKKIPWIKDRLALLIQQRRPQTADDAAQLVREVHADVSREYSKVAARPQVRPGPDSTLGGKTTSPTTAPASMLDAMAAAVDATT